MFQLPWLQIQYEASGFRHPESSFSNLRLARPMNTPHQLSKVMSLLSVKDFIYNLWRHESSPIHSLFKMCLEYGVCSVILTEPHTHETLVSDPIKKRTHNTPPRTAQDPSYCSANFIDIYGFEYEPVDEIAGSFILFYEFHWYGFEYELPVDEIGRQRLRFESPCVSVMHGGHGQSVLAGREIGLDGAPGRDESRSSQPIDLQSVDEVRRHELVDGVQLAQLPIRRDDHWLYHGVAPRAAIIIQTHTHTHSSYISSFIRWDFSGGAVLYIMFESHVRSWPLLKTP